MTITVPNYEVKSVVDVLIFRNENSMREVEMGMEAGKEGYDKHISTEFQPLDFISNLDTWNLFFKKEQLQQLGFTGDDIDDPESFEFIFFHDNADYYFDPFKDNPEDWDEDEYYMVRKSKDEIYWFDHNDPKRPHVLKFHLR